MPTTQPDLANSFVPVYLPFNSVHATGYGFSEPIDSIPYCMSTVSIPKLIAVIQSYGFEVSIFFATPWKDSGFTFNQQVPWLSLPNGAVVNAGIIAEYFNHGVNPFVGTDEETGLIADINYRIQQAQVGNVSI